MQRSAKKMRMCCTMSYIPFGDLIEASQMRRYHKKFNLASEGVRCGLDMKIAKMRHTKRISHSGY